MKRVVDWRWWYLGWGVGILLLVLFAKPAPAAYCQDRPCPFTQPHPECDTYTNCHWAVSTPEMCVYFWGENCEPYFGGTCSRCLCIRECDEGVCFAFLQGGCWLLA